MFGGSLFTSPFPYTSTGDDNTSADKSKMVIDPPSFPAFILPSIPIPFRRRKSSVPTATSALRSSIPSSSTPPSLSTTPGSLADDDAAAQPSTPPQHDTGTLPTPGLTRTHPDTLRCARCSADLALASQIISKGFTGRHGRAYLVGADDTASDPILLPNVVVGEASSRQLATGLHMVGDASCGVCGATLGWKYLHATEVGQRYKVGKFILEKARVVGYRSWEDGEGDRDGVVVREMDGGGTEESKRDSGEDSRQGAGEPVVFDSDDDEECDDIFAGVWDAKVVAKRRASRAKFGGW